MHRILAMLAVVTVTLTGVWSSGRVLAGADDNKCTIATKGDSPVAKACAEGGFKKAKQVMKDLTKAAKAAGQKFQCDDCHKDETKWELTADARDTFKKMLAVALGKK